MFELINNAVKNILFKPIRSILTVLAVSIGIFSMILIDTISNTGTKAVSSELNSLGMNGMTISGTSNVFAELTEDDIEAIKSVNCIENVAPVLVTSSYLVSNMESSEICLWGIEENATDVVDLKLMYGRYFNENDIKLNNTVCLVDTSFAQSVYKRDNIVGKKITVETNGVTEEFEVIGVLKTGGAIFQNVMGSYIPDFVYVPLTVSQNILETNKYHRAFIKINENYDSEYVKAAIEKKLAYSETEYVITNLAKEKKSLDNILEILSIVLTSIGSVSFLVASIGIMCIMLVSVNERTSEIGIKKSIGASNRIIIVEFLIESVLLSVMGCFIGLVLSFVITGIASNLLGIDVIISVKQVVIYLVLSCVTGVVFGVYPAYKAARLKPVEALTQ